MAQFDIQMPQPGTPEFEAMQQQFASMNQPYAPAQLVGNPQYPAIQMPESQLSIDPNKLPPDMRANFLAANPNVAPIAPMNPMSPTPFNGTPMPEQGAQSSTAPEVPQQTKQSGTQQPRQGGGPSMSGDADLNRYRDSLNAATASQAQIKADENLAIAMTQEAADKKLVDLEAKQAERQQRHNAKLAELDAKDAELQGEIAAHKEDPNRFWKARGVGASIAGAIAAGLGAFGSALTKTPNYALNIINDAIDRDIAAQRQEYQVKKDKVALNQNAYARLMQKGASETDVENLLRERALQGLTREITRISTEAGSESALANGRAMIEKTNMEIDQLKFDRQQKRQQTAAAWAAAEARGDGGQKLPAGNAKELGEATAAVQNAQELYKSWNSDAGSAGSWLMSFLPGTAARRYGDKKKAAAQVIGGYLEGGKLTETDFDRYINMLPEESDGKKRAEEKISAIVSLIAKRQSQQKKALAGSGYNVSGIPDARPNIDFKPR